MRKKQLLATLVMLSLMQGSVYAEEITETITSDLVLNEDTTVTASPGISIDNDINITGDHNLTLNASQQGTGNGISSDSDYSLNIDGNLYINNFSTGIDVAFGDSNTLVVDGKTVISNFSYAGIETSAGSDPYYNLQFNGGLEVKEGDCYAVSAVHLQSANMNASSLSIHDIDINRIYQWAGLEALAGSQIDIGTQEKPGTIDIYNLHFNGNNEHFAGIDFDGAIINAGVINIHDIDQKTIDNNNKTNIYGLSGGNLMGYSSWIYADDVNIYNISTENGTAYGLSLTESNGDSLMYFGDLDVNNITGTDNAVGVQVDSSYSEIGNLNISDINSNDGNRYTLLNAIGNASFYVLESANLRAQDSLSYEGHFDDSAQSQAVDINAIALRSVGKSVVNMNSENGIYKIYGTVVAGKGDSSVQNGGGTVNIGGATTQIYGDVFAGNGGTVNITLNGTNSILEGQVDDYHEITSENHQVFHNSAFTDNDGNELDVTSAGKATLNINDGGKWIARGQSFVDTISLDGGIIDMSKNENSSVTVENLTGEGGQFIMRLDTGNHENSDMLYVTGNFEGNHELIINSDEFVASEITKDNPLRFATIKGDVNVENMKARVTDAGFFNNTYNITKEQFDDKDTDNVTYNGSGNGQGSYKPGNDVVTSTFGENDVNLLITAEGKQSQISDAGQTIINMSRANYSNAIYMDRLNKRIGEARYINPEDEQGMWVRLRHDRIGKEDAFRSQNTMYEMGYDVKQDCDNGDRRVGFAIDYMDGKTEYRNVAGDGDIKRYGLWLYDTWMGDKGHYADYVLKWGHIENDFDIYNSRGKVNGDYSNNVFSVSAEYGKKNDMGNDWYFEPQAQLQLARVTGADYVTSQDTKVSLDGINSLIGRAGFRLGKDMGERSTVYVKADVLHEFLGDQTISALDTTTNGTYRETFENKGTWYDVGFGFATALGKDSYAFMDFEKSFGNDNDETYQINAGVQWTF